MRSFISFLLSYLLIFNLNAAYVSTSPGSGTPGPDTVSSGSIIDGTIVNADVNAAASIDATKLGAGSVDNTELGYVNGVTSAIQTQLDGKQTTSLLDNKFLIGNGSNLATAQTISGDATTTNAGVLTIGTGAITSLKIADGSILNADVSDSAAITVSKLGTGIIDNTEFNYLDGVTSSIQTQIDSKQPKALTDNYFLVGNGSNLATAVQLSGDVTSANTGAITIGTGAVTSGKILDGTILNADVSDGANITASKVGTGIIDNTEFNYLNGVSSDIQTQLNNKQALDADLTSIAGNSTGGYLTRTAADTYTARNISPTSDQISVTNSNGVSGDTVIGIASNPVLPGTDSVTLTKGTTAQRGSTVSGKLRFNTETSKFEGNNGTAWGNIGGGLDTWAASTTYAVGDWVRKGQYVFRAKTAHASTSSFLTDYSNWVIHAFEQKDGFFYPGGQADLAVTADISSGSNATFGDSGTIDGTVSVSDTQSLLFDSAVDTGVFLYSSHASNDESNDWFYTTPVRIRQGDRDNGSDYQDIKFRFWYWSGIPDSGIKFKAKCLSGSYSGVITHPASTNVEGLAYTDEDADGAKDAGEGRWAEISYPVHKDCVDVYPGFQVQQDISSTAKFIWNKIEASVWRPGEVDVSSDTGWADAGAMTLTSTGTPPTKGTMTVDKVRWRRVGDSMELEYDFRQGADGTNGTGTYLVGIPQVSACPSSSCLIDTTKVTADTTTDTINNSGSNVGFATISNGEGNSLAHATAHVYSSSYIWFLTSGGVADNSNNTTYATATGDAWGQAYGLAPGTNNTLFKARVTVPIVGWSASNKKLIVPSVEANRAGFYGSVKWKGTDIGDDLCTFGTSVTANAGPVNYTADTDCDDATRTVLGQYNTTSSAIGNSDGQLPQIKFSQIPTGKLHCEAKGTLANSSGTYTARFSDGTNSTSTNTYYAGAQPVSAAVVVGEFNYTSPQGATTIQLQTGSAATQTHEILVRNSIKDEFEISCYFYPDYASNLVSVTALPTVDYSWENTYSAKISASGGTPTVTSSNKSFISSITDVGVGAYTLNIPSGIFQNTPSVKCTVMNAAGSSRMCTTIGITSTTIGIRIGTDTGALSDEDFDIIVSRQGSDYRSVGSTAAVLGQPEVVYSTEYAQGTAGHTYTAGSWTTNTLNTTNSGDAGAVGTVLCTAASTPHSSCTGANQIIFTNTGLYCFDYYAPIYCANSGNNSFYGRIRNSTTSTDLAKGSDEGNSPETSHSDDSGMLTIKGCANITQANSLVTIDYYYKQISGTSTCKDYWSAKNITGYNELAGMLVITKKK